MSIKTTISQFHSKQNLPKQLGWTNNICKLYDKLLFKNKYECFELQKIPFADTVPDIPFLTIS